MATILIAINSRLPNHPPFRFLVIVSQWPGRAHLQPPFRSLVSALDNPLRHPYPSRQLRKKKVSRGGLLGGISVTPGQHKATFTTSFDPGPGVTCPPS